MWVRPGVVLHKLSDKCDCRSDRKGENDGSNRQMTACKDSDEHHRAVPDDPDRCVWNVPVFADHRRYGIIGYLLQ